MTENRKGKLNQSLIALKQSKVEFIFSEAGLKTLTSFLKRVIRTHTIEGLNIRRTSIASVRRMSRHFYLYLKKTLSNRGSNLIIYYIGSVFSHDQVGFLVYNPEFNKISVFLITNRIIYL